MIKRKTPLKRGGGLKKGGKIRVKPRTAEQERKRKEDMERQWEVFMEVWNEREHICFESNQLIKGSPSPINFHHILEKSTHRYKKYMFCKWNIVIVTPEVHALCHSNMNAVPRIQKLTKDLFLKDLVGELEIC